MHLSGGRLYAVIRTRPTLRDRVRQVRGWVARWWLVLSIAAVAGIAAGVLWREVSIRPVVIAVAGTAPPEVSTDVVATISNALPQLRGVTVLPAEMVTGDTPEAISRATGAGVLSYSVTMSADSYRVRLEYRGAEETYSIPVALDSSRRLLVDALPGHVRGLFSRWRSLGRPSLDVGPREWSDYLALRRSTLESETPEYWPRHLDLLEGYVTNHPGAIDARARLCDVARYLYECSHDNSYLLRARAALSEGLSDDRLRYAAAELSVATGDTQAATTLASALPDTHPGKAWVLARTGDSGLRNLRRAVERGTEPKWWYLHTLATEEYRSGRFLEAGALFGQLSEYAPAPAAVGLANVELAIGEPSRALDEFRRLISSSYDPRHYAAAATAEMLIGEYDAAIRDLLRAQDLGFAGAETYVDLGDCQTLSGSDGSPLYRHAVQVSEGSRSLKRAKALASLGRAAEALELLESEYSTPCDQYDAADVYTRLGRPSDADRFSDQARQAGLSFYWFAYLDSIREAGEPEHQEYRGQQ